MKDENKPIYEKDEECEGNCENCQCNHNAILIEDDASEPDDEIEPDFDYPSLLDDEDDEIEIEDDEDSEDFDPDFSVDEDDEPEAEFKLCDECEDTTKCSECINYK